MSALAQIIRDVIAKDGPISVARYMEFCLQHPEHGYYKQHDPLGAKGDFITAPEISQIFGELIGLWCAEVWRAMGSPKAFVLLELGPGRGTLMADALRATRKISGFHEAMQVRLLESNETLRGVQGEMLANYTVKHLETLGALPGLPIIVIANEFFDALPVQQFVKGDRGWHERLVGIEGDALGFVDASPLVDGTVAELFPKEEAHSLREISPLSLSFMRQVALHIAQNGGAGLVIDYGYVAAPGESTLQAVSSHERADVFAAPGEADLTALVDFSALGAIAERQGLQIFGPTGQGAFLEAMGIELRATQLKHRATPEQAEAIDSSVTRLVDTAQMGTLFKVLGFAQAGIADVAGFP